MSAAILSFFVGLADFGGGGGEHDFVRMFAHLLAHGVDLVESAVHGFGASDFARNPDGEEDGAEAAFFHAGDIDAAVGGAFAEIEFAVEETLGGVVVSVDHDGRKMQFAGFF